MGTIVAVVAVAAGISQTGFGHAALERAGLVQHPAAFTALYFLHSDLGEQQAPRHVKYDASFVVQNEGSASRSYNWSVLVSQRGRSRRIGAGTTRVAAGRKAAILQTGSFPCARGQMDIIVKLAHPTEKIDAWVTCGTGGS